MLSARWRHYFPRLINKLRYDVHHEQNVIYAQFGKDLFNISKVIGRKNVAQFFLTHSVYSGWLQKNNVSLFIAHNDFTR